MRDTKKILWENVQALMKRDWNEENLNRLAREAKFGPATASRIKAQKTSVGLEVVDQLARVFKVEPWQLIAPGMAMSTQTMSPYATEIAGWFDKMTDPAKQFQAHSIIYGMCVADRWPALAPIPPSPSPSQEREKTRAK